MKRAPLPEFLRFVTCLCMCLGAAFGAEIAPLAAVEPAAGATGISKSLSEVAPFTPASKQTSAGGTAALTATDWNGTITGSLVVTTFGLTAGAYTVSATLADGSAALLGSLRIQAAQPARTDLVQPWWVQGGSVKDSPFGPGKVVFGGANGLPFPQGLNPFEMTSISISNSSQGSVLTADLTPVATGRYNATAALTATAPAVGASGLASVNAVAFSGGERGALFIRASNLVPNSSYAYAINGQPAGLVQTDSSGNLRVIATDKTFPNLDFFSIASMKVEDATGAVVLSVSF